MMLFHFAKPSLALDQAISLLDSGERCVLAAMRLYVARVRHPDAELPGWWECFASLPAAPIAAHSFEAIMQLIGTTATIRLDVRCIACPALGDGEIRLLNIVARAQAGHVDIVETVLGEILPQAAARCASHIVVAFAGELARGGLALPVRSGLASQETAPPHACPDRGAGLVH